MGTILIQGQHEKRVVEVRRKRRFAIPCISANPPLTRQHEGSIPDLAVSAHQGKNSSILDLLNDFDEENPKRLPRRGRKQSQHRDKSWRK